MIRPVTKTPSDVTLISTDLNEVHEDYTREGVTTKQAGKL